MAERSVAGGQAPRVSALTRRLQQLGAAVEAFERDGFALPPHIAGADADGDEIARIAAQFERMSGRIAEQLALLARRAQQRRELLTKVSHDLRTPTAAMQGYLELLLLRHGSLEPAEQRNYLETAARQSERLARLVADLFQLAELDADDARVQGEDFVLAEVLNDVVQQFSADAQRRRLGLRAQFMPSPQALATLAVHADLRLVERVLGSLIDNALRHTPPGGAVTLECSHDDARARLAVRDSGEGIAPDMLDSLFERYDRSERVAGAGATPHGGLGLSIARRIVQLHGGELAVDSQRGVGTVVRFDLPLAARPSASPQAAPQAVPADRIELLEQRCREQQSAIARSEAARERAEAELRAVEQRYLMALRGSQDGLWEWELASGRVQLSPRWKGMLGFDSHEIDDDRAAWFDRVHADDRAALEAALQRHIADRDGTPFDHELRLLHKDGSVRHVLSRGVAIRHENGTAYRMVGLDTDVSRVKRLQEVLDAVAEGTAGAHGDAFLPALVRNFARALQVDRAFIAQCLDDPPLRVRTLACWERERGDVANFEFALQGTPCQAVIQQNASFFHRQDLQRLFPRERGWEAYLGLPIVGSDGRVLGHLAFFDRAPRGDEMLLGSVYRIFLARAASELERRQLPRPGAALHDPRTQVAK